MTCVNFDLLHNLILQVLISCLSTAEPFSLPLSSRRVICLLVSSAVSPPTTCPPLSSSVFSPVCHSSPVLIVLTRPPLSLFLLTFNHLSPCPVLCCPHSSSAGHTCPLRLLIAIFSPLLSQNVLCCHLLPLFPLSWLLLSPGVLS